MDFAAATMSERSRGAAASAAASASASAPAPAVAASESGAEDAASPGLDRREPAMGVDAGHQAGFDP